MLLTLPTQVERGFPDLPIDSEGDDKPFVVDDGSGTDVYVTDLPAILMPGPVIIDDLPLDDDDISSGSAVELPTISSPSNDATTDDMSATPEVHFTVDDASTGTVGDAATGVVDETDGDAGENTDTTVPATAQPVAADDDDNEKRLLPLYVALLVCISLLIVVMVIMIVMVIILKRKVAGRRGDRLSEEDKVSLMKEGYVNPTYQFFDKTSTSQ